MMMMMIDDDMGERGEPPTKMADALTEFTINTDDDDVAAAAVTQERRLWWCVRREVMVSGALQKSTSL